MPLYKLSHWWLFLCGVEYSKDEVIFTPMPLPEIHYSHAFGMGFWIAEDGTLMSCPAVHHTMDVDNAIAVDEWDDFSVYSHNHMADTRTDCADMHS